MRYLWLVSFTMVAAGIVLIAAYLAGIVEVIALVAGVLLLWSAVVKVIVLRIWRWSLSMPGVSEGRPRPPAKRPVGGQTR